MPLIQVDLDADVYETLGDRISAEIHQAQIDALGTPPDDLFQVFRPRAAGELKYDAGYNGLARTSLLLIQITMVHMFPVATKRALFVGIADRLVALGIKRDDIHIAVTENGFEDWFAGK